MRNQKRIRLYADADIEDDLIEFFRSNKVNVITARELGYANRDDRFHATYAYKQNRFVLTKNCKHFLDDDIVPYQNMRGVIAIDGDMSDVRSYARVATIVLRNFIPYAQHYDKCKIRISPEELTLRYLDYSGKMTIERFKIADGRIYQWVEE